MIGLDLGRWPAERVRLMGHASAVSGQASSVGNEP